MITQTPSEAIDTMNQQFYNWIRNGEAFALLGYVPVIYWGNERANKPDATKYFARVSHQTVLERQATLSVCEGIAGQKRYRTSGLTFVQIFAPTSDKEVQDKARKLATICRNAFRGALAHSGNDAVWFYNARINDNLAPENDLYRLNVVAEHEYDELG